MKNKSLIVALILVFAIGGGLLFAKNKSSKPNSSQTINSTKTKKLKLSDWLAKKQSLICTISTDKGTTTIYVKGDKIKIDGLNNMAGIGQGYYLQVNQYAYIWGKNKTTGIKYALNEQESNTENNQENQPQKFDLKAMEQAWNQMNYHCQPKSLNDSLFVPPTNIKFVDINHLMNSMQNLSNPQDMQQKMEELQNAFK